MDPELAATMLDEKLAWHLNELKTMSTEARLAARREKFRNIAQFYTT
jgi:acetyl-CoA carboxylase carboxyl transferase subunit alpha